MTVSSQEIKPFYLYHLNTKILFSVTDPIPSPSEIKIMCPNMETCDSIPSFLQYPTDYCCEDADSYEPEEIDLIDRVRYLFYTNLN